MDTRHTEIVVLPPVPERQVAPVPAFADDVVERCYEIWAGLAAMNAEATERRYSLEVGEGAPVPTAHTIRSWVVALNWREQRNEDFKRNHGERVFEIEMRDLANYEASQAEVSKVLAGVYDDNPAGGALRLQAHELHQHWHKETSATGMP